MGSLPLPSAVVPGGVMGSLCWTHSAKCLGAQPGLEMVLGSQAAAGFLLGSCRRLAARFVVSSRADSLGSVFAQGRQEESTLPLPAPARPLVLGERGSGGAPPLPGRVPVRCPPMLCLCRVRDWLPQAGVAEPAVIMSRRAPSMLTSHYLCYCNYIIRCFMQNYSPRTN